MANFKLKNLILQFLFGIDTTIAIACYSILGIIFDIFPTIDGLIFSFICAYLPDSDLVIFLLIRKKFKIKTHWIIGHHPFLIIPSAGVLTWLISNELNMSNATFLTVLAFVCVSAHFVHDSVDAIGLHWFSPFYWKRFTFQHGWPKVANPIDWERRRKKLENNFKKSIEAEILVRMERISTTQIVSLMLVITIFGFWIFFLH